MNKIIGFLPKRHDSVWQITDVPMNFVYNQWCHKMVDLQAFG